jgi:hypothetical protein
MQCEGFTHRIEYFAWKVLICINVNWKASTEIFMTIEDISKRLSHFAAELEEFSLFLISHIQIHLEL